MAKEGATTTARHTSHSDGILGSILSTPISASAPSQHDGEERARKLLFAFEAVFLLKAVVILKIPDILARDLEHGAGLSVTQIAAKLQCEKPNVNALGRILRFVAAQGFLEESGTFEDPCYGLNNASNCLFGSEMFSKNMLLRTQSANLGASNHLHEVVTDNCLAFERANGKPIFEFAKENPDYDKIFNECMASNTRAVMGDVVKHYLDFKDLKTLVDLGGGIGAALSEIVRSYPHIDCINFDLPHVVVHAPPIPGVEHVGGDMFQSVPSADAILIKSVLHDWDDERCLKILRNCHSALPTKGRVIVVEQILQYSRENSIELYEQMALHLDVRMLALAYDGRLRSEAEWRELLPKAGFTNVSIVHLPSRTTSLIEAYKL